MEMEYLAVAIMRLQEYDVEVECLSSHYQKIASWNLFVFTAPCLSDDQVDLIITYGSPSNVTSGVVRVCSNGSGGVVCDSGWDHADARVACKAAGYSPYGEANLKVTVNSALMFSSDLTHSQVLLVCQTSTCHHHTLLSWTKWVAQAMSLTFLNALLPVLLVQFLTMLVSLAKVTFIIYSYN